MSELEKIIKYFESQGYRYHHQTGISFPYSDGFWQKRFEDGAGIRYFLEFVYYSEKSGSPFAFMANLNNNGDGNIFHQTYQQHHLNTIEKIKQAEINAKNFWLTLGNYYDLYHN